MAVGSDAYFDQDVVWSKILGNWDSVNLVGFVKLDCPFSPMPQEQMFDVWYLDDLNGLHLLRDALEVHV